LTNNSHRSLWRDKAYRRLWLSLLSSGFAGQIAGVALSLTAATLLHASPAQMGILGAMAAIPFTLFMLPAGVWLDRVRKLPVYVGGELVMALTLASVPIAWSFDRLGIELLYAVAFVSSSVSVFSGTAGQVILTQLVHRDQLVEAHSKNRVAGTFSEIAGPGAAGILMQWLGAPVALLANCCLMLLSAGLLRHLPINEPLPQTKKADEFWVELKQGIHFVCGERLLLSMALAVGCWQVFQTCAMVTSVLFATRELGMSVSTFGLCLTGAGLGSVVTGALGHHFTQRVGMGPAMIAGMALSGVGWLQLVWAPVGALGLVSFIGMMVCFSSSVVLIFSNMLALRQLITPVPLLSRMTSTMRWVTLFPALPGTLLGGFLADQWGLRVPLLVGGAGAMVLAMGLWRYSAIRHRGSNLWRHQHDE